MNQETNNEIKIYHYTKQVKLKAIISSGMIKQSTICRFKGEKISVSLSSNSFWENTVNMGNYEKTYDTFGAARIEVKYNEKNIVNWETYRKQSGLKKEVLDALEKSGKDIGANPSEWYACFGRIPKSQWVKIEVLEKFTTKWGFEGYEWIEYNKDIPLKDLKDFKFVNATALIGGA